MAVPSRDFAVSGVTNPLAPSCAAQYQSLMRTPSSVTTSTSSISLYGAFRRSGGGGMVPACGKYMIFR